VQGRQHSKTNIVKNMLSNMFFRDSFVYMCKVGGECVKQEGTADRLNNGIVMDKRGRVFVGMYLSGAGGKRGMEGGI
jgi:hypothetical protein